MDGGRIWRAEQVSNSRFKIGAAHKMTYFSRRITTPDVAVREEAQDDACSSPFRLCEKVFC